MRHLWTLIAGLVAAPLAWLLLAAGQHRSRETVEGWEAAGAFDTAELIGPALLLLAVGVPLGLLGTLRWSPVGPLVAGLLLLLPTAGMFVDPFWTFDLVDAQWELFGQTLALREPAGNGTMLVLGALLVMAVFSAHRWRRPGAVTTTTAAAPPAADGDAEAAATTAATRAEPAAATPVEPAAETTASTERASATGDAESVAGDAEPTAAAPTAGDAEPTAEAGQEKNEADLSRNGAQ